MDTTLEHKFTYDKVSSPEVNDDIESKELRTAEYVATQTGSLMPILKQELKYFIQNKRLSEGKDEIQIVFQPEQCHDLTPEELHKQTERREQNRRAAKRFRQRQKTTEENLKKKTQSLQSQNTALRHEIANLNKEKENLQEKLREHLQNCLTMDVCA